MSSVAAAMLLASSALYAPARGLLRSQVRMMGGGFGAPAKDTFKYAGKMRPGRQSPPRKVPKGIKLPDYARDGRPKAKGPILPWQIEVKSAADIEGMRAAGRIAREVLDAAGRMVAPGVKTDAIDAFETKRSDAWPWLDGATTRVPDDMLVPKAEEFAMSR